MQAKGSASAAPASEITLKLTVHTLAALLSQHPLPHDPAGAAAHDTGPVFEFAAAARSADARDLGGGCLGGTARATLQLAAFSGHKLGWEPVLEPWKCK